MEDIQRDRLAQSLHHAHETRNNSYTVIDYIRGLEQRIEKLKRKIMKTEDPIDRNTGFSIR